VSTMQGESKKPPGGLKTQRLKGILDNESSAKRKQVKKRVTYVNFFEESTKSKPRPVLT